MSHNSAPDFNPLTDPAAVSAESLGTWLARTRAEQGAESCDMARRLGLNPILIKALEDDDFERLGPPVFVRGYLSRYARLLNLPEQAVLDRYRQQSGTRQEPPPLKVVHPRRRQTRVRDLRGLLYLLVVVGIGWTAVQNLGELNLNRLTAWWANGYSSNKSGAQPANEPMAATSQTQYPFQPKPDAATSEPAVPPPPAPAAREPVPEPRPEPDAASAIALTLPPTPLLRAEPDSALTTPGVTIATTATVSATVEGRDSSATDPRSDARLMLQFSEDCWVEVKDAQGKVLANGLMKANTTHEIAGPAPFTVTLGNAPAARIALDDRLVDTAVYVPRRGTVSRFTLNPQP